MQPKTVKRTQKITFIKLMIQNGIQSGILKNDDYEDHTVEIIHRHNITALKFAQYTCN